MAIIAIFAGNRLDTGRLCVCSVGCDADSRDFRICDGAGLFGAGNYLFGFKGIEVYNFAAL